MLCVLARVRAVLWPDPPQQIRHNSGCIPPATNTRTCVYSWFFVRFVCSFVSSAHGCTGADISSRTRSEHININYVHVHATVAVMLVLRAAERQVICTLSGGEFMDTEDTRTQRHVAAIALSRVVRSVAVRSRFSFVRRPPARFMPIKTH